MKAQFDVKPEGVRPKPTAASRSSLQGSEGISHFEPGFLFETRASHARQDED